MAEMDYLSEELVEGEDFIYRYDEAGYNCTVLYRINPDGTELYTSGGENIAMTPIGYSENCGDVQSEDQISNCTVMNWIGNQEARENILASYWEKHGVGVSISSSGNVYITEDFC